MNSPLAEMNIEAIQGQAKQIKITGCGSLYLEFGEREDVTVTNC